MTTSKEALDRNAENAARADDSSIAVQENVPDKTGSPVENASASGETSPESSYRLPVTSRKNIIPSRRTSFETSQPSTQLIKKSSLNGARFTADISQQLTLSQPVLATLQMPAENVEAEAKQDSQTIVEITASIETQILPIVREHAPFPDVPTTPIPVTPPVIREIKLTRGKAFLLVTLLCIVVINATTAGFGQFFGPQGWGSVFNSSGNNASQNLLQQLNQQLHQHGPTPNATNQVTQPAPQQIVDQLLAHMTLDEKLGQMMLVQFNGATYSPQISAMISQYKVGSVILFPVNGNIVSKTQVRGLISEMQKQAFLPLTVSVDQEGGTVDRLINLDGPQPSASSLGATGNPNKVYQQGIKDAQALAGYGFNLNLAPVVDVTNVYNRQLDGRTYGNTPALVTTMASAYLKGLQQSGKVLGTLKHFPGLGDTSTDPHYGLPALTRPLGTLNAIDWTPYRELIQQGQVYSIMVTHEIVNAVDKTEPSSLSPQVIGILRNQLHFQGVIITDSLTMEAIHNYYTYGDAAAKAVEAGDDILMGAASPNNVAAMIAGIKQAISSGSISMEHIDASVRRILMLKYQMGLLRVTA
ncbi:MAG TPA: glycoside hydrolase family 3 N-terminal domain-containing protein [Ktedonobacteraceae bacterium]|nr:glycoside hydrolase family 3 N-terminal domain-containing protein [Ktedonobacteraceae bacterium]